MALTTLVFETTAANHVPHWGQYARNNNQLEAWRDYDYRQVVKIRTQGEGVLALAGVDASETSPLEVELPEEFGDRLVGFCRAYLVEDAGLLEYTCHGLAYAVAEGRELRPRSKALERLVRKGHEVESLPVGEHGVIATIDHKGRPRPQHSALGLTPEECLHVSRPHGPLAIDRYSTVKRLYGDGARLYVASARLN